MFIQWFTGEPKQIDKPHIAIYWPNDRVFLSRVHSGIGFLICFLYSTYRWWILYKLSGSGRPLWWTRSQELCPGHRYALRVWVGAWVGQVSICDSVELRLLVHLTFSMRGSHAPDYSTRRVACGQRLASSGFKIFILVICMWRLLRFAVVVPAASSRPDMSRHARLKQFVPLLLELFKCAWECICKHLVKPHIRIATKPFDSLTGGSRAEQLQIHWGNQCPID